jgi:hypothetical protein
MEYSKKRRAIAGPVDWMTKLGLHDRGDAGVAIVDRAAAEAQRSRHLADVPMFWETALVSLEKPALRSPAGKRLVPQPV